MIYDALKKLGKHSAIYALGPAVSKALGFLLLPFVTAYIGSTANYGVTEIAGVTLAVAGQLLGINLLYGMTRFYHDYESEAERGRLVSTALLLLSLSTGLAFVAALVFREQGARLLFGSAEYAGALVVVAAILFFQTVAQVGLRYLQIIERSITYGVLTTSKLVCEIGLKVWLLAGLGLTFMGVLYSILGGELLIATGLGIAIFGRVGLRFSPAMARRLIRYSAPLIISGLCMFVLHEADRFFILRYHGEGQVGLYGLCYKLGAISNAVLLEAFGLIWFPYVFALKDQEEIRQLCRRVLTYFTLLTCFASLALAVFSAELFSVMADDKFFEAQRAMPIIVAGYVFWSIFQIVHTAFYLRERTGQVSMLVACAALANLLLNALLVPVLGYPGAAWATLITFALLALGAWYFAERLLPIGYELGRVALPIALSGLLFGASRALPLGGGALGSTRPLAIGLKALLVLALPAILWFAGYLKPEEKGKINALFRELQSTLMRRPRGPAS